MMRRLLVASICVLASVSLVGCGGAAGDTTPETATANTSSPVDESGSAPATTTGVEKVKPAPGTGNVQGKVLYNGKPVEGIEVKLCETFSRFMGGCGGKTYTARTDAGGEYVITNVEPKTYEGLMARVFETDSYVFATTGIGGLNSAKYDVTADKTMFVAPTNLFKSDLKVTNPKAGSKTSAQGLELKWEPYPDAAYYKFSLYPSETGVISPYINSRTDSPSASIDKPIQKGTYRLEVEAYNSSDVKLSENSNDLEFTITDGTSQ